MRFENYTLTNLALAGLLFLGGCGGGSSDGSSSGGIGIPSASNPAITPPSTTPVAINTGAPETNRMIAAAVFQAVDGASVTTELALGLVPVGVQVSGSAAESRRLTLVEIVRRHAEKIKDHKLSGSVTGVQTVDTLQCFVGGTDTFVFDDVSGNASQIFVNCDDGFGVVLHGTLSSVINSFSGGTGNFTVNATVTIDLSVKTTGITPVEELVTQGSMSFTATFSGTTIDIAITNASLLSSVGGVTEQFVNFNLTVVEDGAGNVTVTSSTPFTFASTTIGGVVTVDIVTPIVFGAFDFHPSSGVIEITGAPGKIILTIQGPLDADGVRIQVFSDSAGTVLVDDFTLTWTQFEALI